MLRQKMGPDGKPLLDDKGQLIMEDDGQGSGGTGTPPVPEGAKDKEGKPLTQEAFDALFKKYKETEERLNRSEKEKVDLIATKKHITQPPPINTEVEFGPQEDGSYVFPQTKDEWEDLFDEDPVLATDLRNEYHRQLGDRNKTLGDSQKKSALKVAEKLPDMYKKDTEGKVLLDSEGHPVPDTESETYKLFAKVAMESGTDPYTKRPIILAAADGPYMVALQVMEKLGQNREDELKRKSKEEMEKAEKDRENKVKAGQTAPKGHQPPPKTKSEVKFNSQAERQAAEVAVSKGSFASLEEYCAIRDNKEIPYNRGV